MREVPPARHHRHVCVRRSALVYVCVRVCVRVCTCVSSGTAHQLLAKDKALNKVRDPSGASLAPNPPISLHSCTSDTMLSRSAAAAHANSTRVMFFWMPIYWIIGLRSSMPCLGFSLRVICSASRSERNSQTLNNRKVLGTIFFGWVRIKRCTLTVLFLSWFRVRRR